MDNDGDNVQSGASGSNDLRPLPGPAVRPLRACDACRTRKIRCNRESPCAHCARAGIECTLAAGNPRDKRTRILLTPQYEKKFDQIDDRLDCITELLRELKDSMSTGTRPTTKSSHDTCNNQLDEPARSSPPLQKAAPDSDSTMALHSSFAKDIVQRNATVSPLRSNTDEMRDLISSLEHVVNSLKPSTAAVHSISFPFAKTIPRPSLGGRDLPPIEKVVGLIQDPKVAPISRYSPVFALVPKGTFSDLCLSTYFSPNFCEIAFITINAGLFYLFQECSSIFTEEKVQYWRYAELCRSNLDTALSQLPLYLPSTSETLIGLLCGAFYALDISEPTLSWTLLVKASEICQTLGYQHLETPHEGTTDEVQHKKFLFWFLYTLDKGLVLRLGRASTLSEWDVTTPLPALPLNQFLDQPIQYSLHWSVKAARCQGNIHEMLYSPAALVQPDHVKRSRVQLLEGQLEELAKEIHSIHGQLYEVTQKGEGADLMHLTLLCQDITRLSLLTLIYRAVSSSTPPFSTFDEQCVSTARTTLDRFESYLDYLTSATAYVPTYLRSIVLYAPIAFITIFCHAVEALDQCDVGCLQSFQAAVDHMSHNSEPIRKMQRLFRVLSSLASQYVECRRTAIDSEQNSNNAHSGRADSEPCVSLDVEDGMYRTMNPMMWLDGLQQTDEWLFNIE